MIPADNDYYDPGYEPVSIPPAAPRKNRIYSAIAKFLFAQASKFESRAFGYLFVSPRRLNGDADLTPVLEVVNPREELKKALENDDVRDGVLSGYNAPRRSEAEQLELIRANAEPAVFGSQHEFVWADASGNAGNSGEGDVLGPDAR